MNIPDIFSITGLSSEEFDLITKVLKEHRAEVAKKEAIQAHADMLRDIIMATIDAIGLEETKRLVRAANANLRNAH